MSDKPTQLNDLGLSSLAESWRSAVGKLRESKAALDRATVQHKSEGDYLLSIEKDLQAQADLYESDLTIPFGDGTALLVSKKPHGYTDYPPMVYHKRLYGLNAIKRNE